MWLALVTQLCSAMTPVELHTEVQTHAASRAIADRPIVPGSAYAKVAPGKVVTGLEFIEGVDAGQAWGLGILEVPLEDVWSALYDIESHPERLGNVAHSHILKTVGGDRVVFQRIDLPLVSDRSWVVRQSVNQELHQATQGQIRELTATLTDQPLPAHLQPVAEGAIAIPLSRSGWLLMDMGDGRTLVEYWLWTDPGGKLPAGPVSRFAPGAIRNLLGKLEAAALAP